MVKGSVGVPYRKLDPDLQVLHVFGPPGPDPFVRGTVPDLEFLRLKVFFASLKSLKKGV
jgi:hypothetical protein